MMSSVLSILTSPIAEPLATGTIGYVVKRYPRFSETFVVNEILAHEEAGRQLAIFALRPVAETHFQNIISQVRAPVTYLPQPHRRQNGLWAAQKALAELDPEALEKMIRFAEASEGDMAQAIHLALACRKQGITHLHAHFGTLAATVTRIAAALADIPWSVTLHAKDIYCDYAENHYLPLKLHDADAVVTVSEYNRDHLIRKQSADPARLYRLYNGIDLERFTWSAPNASAKEILAVGRLVEKKGFHILIEALRLLHAEGHDIRARIIGSGEMQAELVEQIAGSGLSGHIILDGPRPQSKIVEAMRHAAFLACPCIVGTDGNRDGMPTVLLEAMALGCPVVATPVTGIPELVDKDSTGLLATEGDPRDLADQMLRLLNNPDLRNALSHAAITRIRHDFDLRANATRLRELIDSCAPRPATHTTGASSSTSDMQEAV
ncbi:MAG: glycosyltransferase [Paracoccus sp. (in: a-proteobacteria)]